MCITDLSPDFGWRGNSLLQLIVLNSALGLARPTCISASFARWTAEGGCPSVSFSAACGAGTANKAVIAAVNRCATQKQNQNRVFQQTV
jgi:hypothetical protein